MRGLVQAVALASLSVSALSASLATGQVYKWVDADGTVHFSQDYNTLGGSDRSDEEKARTGQDVEVMPLHGASPPGEAPDPDAGPPGPDEGDPIEITMSPTGGGNHMLRVQINGRVTVPMLLDTGASDVVITHETARMLGLTDRDVIEHRTYSTANGLVQQPVVRFHTVKVGEATAHLVQGSISPTMEIGLLGTSFLRQFEYTISGRTLILRRGAGRRG